jgi:hypothetical protein
VNLVSFRSFVSFRQACVTSMSWVGSVGGEARQGCGSRHGQGSGSRNTCGLRRVHQKLERWRSTRQGRSPLPEGLWRAAAAAAREHGVFRTGKVLHLEYGKLKRMMNSMRGKTQAPTRFVELASLSNLGGDECVIELEGTRGKLRLRLRGSAAEDLTGLTRALWEIVS